MKVLVMKKKKIFLTFYINIINFMKTMRLINIEVINKNF